MSSRRRPRVPFEFSALYDSFPFLKQIRVLERQDRLLLHRYYIRSASLQQVADQMGMTKTAAYSRIKRLLKLMGDPMFRLTRSNFRYLPYEHRQLAFQRFCQGVSVKRLAAGKHYETIRLRLKSIAEKIRQLEASRRHSSI